MEKPKEIASGEAAGSSPVPCSAWISATSPPSRTTRVIAKNDYDDLAEAVWLDGLKNMKDGFYVPVNGGVKIWEHVTHYILWPDAEADGHPNDRD